MLKVRLKNLKRNQFLSFDSFAETVRVPTDYVSVGFQKCRQNGAPSGLEKRGLDARFAFTTKQENQQKERNEKKSVC
ncbi:hypothetical protein QMN07_16790, partial [Leptospira santarosai]|uniref:hypothetical protein n=1 Tax=Leptospira santarosai TaxID=28183 RepID=UPI0024AFB12E